VIISHRYQHSFAITTSIPLPSPPHVILVQSGYNFVVKLYPLFQFPHLKRSQLLQVICIAFVNITTPV